MTIMRPRMCVCVTEHAAGRQSDRQVAPEVTGESCSLRAGRQSLLLGHCSSSPPLSPPSALVARWGIRRRHTSARAHTQTRSHTHTHARSLRLSPSLSPVLLFWEVAFGITPRVRTSVCERPPARQCARAHHRVYVSPDFTLRHARTHALVTQSDAHSRCVSGCSGGSGGAPAARIRSERILSIFTRNFSAPARRTCPRLPRSTVVDFVTGSRQLPADNPRGVKPARNRICCQRGLLVVISRSETEARSRSADGR